MNHPRAQKTDNDSLALSKPNSTLPTVRMINTNIDNISNESPLTKQIENNVIEEYSAIKLQPTIDKTERHDNQSIQDELSPSKRK